MGPDQREQQAGIGERIGPYRLVEIMGSGGMGDVYKAVRDDDQYRAEVAIKLMRADVRNPHAERRFKSERQILAALDHRNIARLLDGGATPRGLPYVVMELISGVPIDRYCEVNKLDTRSRVQLFLQVCSAVSYAHQHLVVHRDLKPGNILVTADGSAKLLDFGIAKLLEADAISDTPVDETRTQFRAMTLEYASPEQLSGGNVTTVSDVYSLGVVLYRLLTGQSPYRTTSGDAARLAEILGDTTPTRPSALATRERRAIDADLDYILLMALRKEPAKRYASVEQLANDLRNYLQGDAIIARRGTFGYRGRKFLRRHRVPIAAAVLVALSLIVGTAFTVREARIANIQRASAQRHFDSVRKLANKLFDFHDEIARLEGSTKAREMLVKTSLEYLDTLNQHSGTDPDLREELAEAYRRVGDVQGSDLGPNLGDHKGARQSYARSIELLEPLAAAKPARPRAGVSLAKAYLQQGRLTLYTDGATAALPMLLKAVKQSEAVQHAFEKEVEGVGHLGDVYTAAADALAVNGRVPEAMAALDKMVVVTEAYSLAHPEEIRGLEVLTGSYNSAAALTDDEMPMDAYLARVVPLFQKAIRSGERLIALRPDNPSYRWSLAETRFNYADALYDNADYTGAVALLRQASAVFHAQATDPNDARAQFIRSFVDSTLARALMMTGELDAAEPIFADAEARLLALAKEGDTLRIQFALTKNEIHHGLLLVQRAKAAGSGASARLDYWRRARSLLAEGIARGDRVHAKYPLTGGNRIMLNEAATGLAETERAIAAR